MNRDYTGEYDAVVLASDQSTIDFYRKFWIYGRFDFIKQILVNFIYL
jgi:hypothetical protein